jgi:hypothetical protein
MSRPFTSLNAQTIARSLARKFVPIADNLRDLYTKFGLRPYIVRIVRTRWTDAERGEGGEFVVKSLDLLPTPKVSDLSAINEILHPIGLDEVGGIVVTELSGRFTEEQLRGLDDDGSEAARDEQVYWEIEFVRLDGREGERRRFQLSAAPYYNASTLQWSVKLERTHGERTRSGEPR